MSIYLKKLNELRQLIKFHGGIKGSYWTMYQTDSLKIGVLKGTDKFGNRYYENRNFFIGRSRWVEYSDAFGTDYDASMVAPEWRMWLQYSREESPVDKPATPHKWLGDYIDNKSGTSEEYVPYSTTRPKVQSWQPPQ